MSADPFAYRLEDCYRRDSGRVFLTGTQALVRVLLMQRALDRAAGLSTAGFVTGYRGSPLGGLDQALWRAGDLLRESDIAFLPAINEDLAATAALGSQQVESDPHRTVDGVFALWYGKGPGVDRSGDALRHGNAYGSSPHGGVLVVAGDDHGCVSSSMPHQSDVAFMAWLMPTLNPASVAEYLSFGLYGYALSRFSGSWIGFKAVSETVESAMSVVLPPPPVFVVPDDFTPPPGGLHYRWPDLPGPQIETRLEAKKQAAFAFMEANPIDRPVFGTPDATYGIVTTGKGHLDLMEALRLLGIDAARARALGLEVYKVGVVWPLARRSALAFVRGKREVLVVEEKRGIIESQFKEYFYDEPGEKPERMVGKRDEAGARLVPWTGELSPLLLAPIVARRLDAAFPGLDLAARAAALTADQGTAIEIEGATRTPYFCAGCPHNTSTRVPEGSTALAGIGCHFMASWMDRDTTSLIQMGGEGVNWVARSRFNGGRHVFQNLGEGTFYHSGSMAIRQAVAAGATLTYKILFNDAVAMTGGQPVDGPITVPAVAQMVRAEGVERIAVVAEDPARHRGADLPPRTTLHPRSELDAVQREMREIPGVTVLIYDQGCAAEKRRKRKRGALPDPARHVVINELVCEGCGDCSAVSNCLAVVPVETPFGRKRRVDLDACNKDLSCLDGFCPSFVTVEGGARRRRAGADPQALETRVATLPDPALPASTEPWDLLVTGVGGTGVITVGQIVAMAAFLDGKGASVLDFTGFAQKFGPVLSHVRLAADPDRLGPVRVDRHRLDALIGCDLVVSTSPKASATYRRGATRAVVSADVIPTGDLVRDRDADLAPDRRLAALRDVLGPERVATLPATRLATALAGATVYANILLLGAAWQRGLVPVRLEALEAAIRLNGVAVAANLAAFRWGRVVAARPEEGETRAGDPGWSGEDLDAAVARRAAFLRAYQDDALAARYRALVDRVAAAERAATGGAAAGLADAVAHSYFRLLAIKDEYEVARLHSDSRFIERLSETFDGDYRVVFHLAPPGLPGPKDARGRPAKRRFGPWILPALRGLARLRRLRGTRLDVFGLSAERRRERALVPWYEAVVARLLAGFGPESAAEAAAIARLPLEIRGFGPVKEAAMTRVRAACEARLAAYAGDGTLTQADPIP